MDMKVGSIIALAIFVVVAMSLVPTIFTTINGTNTSAWSALTGGSGAKAIFELVLLVFCAAIIVIIVRQALE